MLEGRLKNELSLEDPHVFASKFDGKDVLMLPPKTLGEIESHAKAPAVSVTRQNHAPQRDSGSPAKSGDATLTQSQPRQFQAPASATAQDRTPRAGAGSPDISGDAAPTQSQPQQSQAPVSSAAPKPVAQSANTKPQAPDRISAAQESLADRMSRRLAERQQQAAAQANASAEEAAQPKAQASEQARPRPQAAAPTAEYLPIERAISQAQTAIGTAHPEASRAIGRIYSAATNGEDIPPAAIETVRKTLTQLGAADALSTLHQAFPKQVPQERQHAPATAHPGTVTSGPATTESAATATRTAPQDPDRISSAQQSLGERMARRQQSQPPASPAGGAHNRTGAVTHRRTGEPLARNEEPRHRAGLPDDVVSQQRAQTPEPLAEARRTAAQQRDTPNVSQAAARPKAGPGTGLEPDHLNGLLARAVAADAIGQAKTLEVRNNRVYMMLEDSPTLRQSLSEQGFQQGSVTRVQKDGKAYTQVEITEQNRELLGRQTRQRLDQQVDGLNAKRQVDGKPPVGFENTPAETPHEPKQALQQLARDAKSAEAANLGPVEQSQRNRDAALRDALDHEGTTPAAERPVAAPSIEAPAAQTSPAAKKDAPATTAPKREGPLPVATPTEGPAAPPRTAPTTAHPSEAHNATAHAEAPGHPGPKPPAEHGHAPAGHAPNAHLAKGQSITGVMTGAQRFTNAENKFEQAMGLAEMAGSGAELVKPIAKRAGAIGTAVIVVDGVVTSGKQAYDAYNQTRERGGSQLDAAKAAVVAGGDTAVDVGLSAGANIATLGMAGNASHVLYERAKEHAKEQMALTSDAMGMMSGQQEVDVGKLAKQGYEIAKKDLKATGQAIAESTPGKIVTGVGEMVSTAVEVHQINEADKTAFVTKATASDKPLSELPSTGKYGYLDRALGEMAREKLEDGNSYTLSDGQKVTLVNEEIDDPKQRLEAINKNAETLKAVRADLAGSKPEEVTAYLDRKQAEIEKRSAALAQKSTSWWQRHAPTIAGGKSEEAIAKQDSKETAARQDKKINGSARAELAMYQKDLANYGINNKTDANKDGKITAQEAVAFADKDGDGKLNTLELKSIQEALKNNERFAAVVKDLQKTGIVYAGEAGHGTVAPSNVVAATPQSQLTQRS